MVNVTAKKTHVLKRLSNMRKFFENKLVTQIPEGKTVKSLGQIVLLY